MRRVNIFRKRIAKGEKPTMRNVEKFFFNDLEHAGKNSSFASVMDTEWDVLHKRRMELKNKKR